jgi:hypothetical protein
MQRIMISSKEIRDKTHEVNYYLATGRRPAAPAPAPEPEPAAAASHLQVLQLPFASPPVQHLQLHCVRSLAQETTVPGSATQLQWRVSAVSFPVRQHSVTVTRAYLANWRNGTFLDTQYSGPVLCCLKQATQDLQAVEFPVPHHFQHETSQAQQRRPRQNWNMWFEFPSAVVLEDITLQLFTSLGQPITLFPMRMQHTVQVVSIGPTSTLLSIQHPITDVVQQGVVQLRALPPQSMQMRLFSEFDMHVHLDNPVALQYISAVEYRVTVPFVAVAPALSSALMDVTLVDRDLSFDFVVEYT